LYQRPPLSEKSEPIVMKNIKNEKKKLIVISSQRFYGNMENIKEESKL
jgi:hypothetical protein